MDEYVRQILRELNQLKTDIDRNLRMMRILTLVVLVIAATTAWWLS